MSIEFSNSPPAPLPNSEERTYQELDDLIASVERDPKTSFAKELKENELSKKIYSDFMAEWLGVEVASLYAAPLERGWGRDPERKPIEFLYEAVPEAVDLPMFWVSAGENGDNKPLRPAEVPEAEGKYRREEQDKKRRSPREQLSAELCARHLRKHNAESRPYLLLPFGEILSYCFLYHVLGEIPPDISAAAILWHNIGRQAWNKLCQAHVKRPGSTRAGVEVLLRNTLREWYFIGAAKETFSFRAADNISAIYLLDAEITKLLEAVNGQALDESPDFAHFLMQWAQALHNNLQSSSNANALIDSFWRKTLVNPDIEELLCSRGLYVTIIRSPFTRDVQASSHLSEAYAICTLFDANRLKANENWRQDLDNVLHRVGHDDLATYDFLRLKRTDDYQDRILELLRTVSEADSDWQELMQEAARVTLKVSNAVGVIIAWSDIGAMALFRNPRADNETKETYTARWFGYLSALSMVINRLSADLPLDRFPRAGMSNADYKALRSVFRKLGVRNWEKEQVRAFSCGERFGTRRGAFILFLGQKDQLSFDTAEQIARIGLALGVGMDMPFRSAINRGLLSWVLGVLGHPLENVCFRIWRRLKRLWRYGRTCKVRNPRRMLKGHRKAGVHRILDWSIASIVEFIQIGFAAIGVLFLCSVFSMLFYTLCRLFSPVDDMCRRACKFLGRPPPFNDQTVTAHIVETVRNIEHTVMAFSICLAATGVIFLLKPDLAANQPLWMRSFAKLGTLERTLVRLAAIVMTIDVLAVVLNAGESSPSFEQLQPTLVHIGIYLLVLAGLAFISKFLLSEDDPK